MALDPELQAQFDRLHTDHLYQTALALHKIDVATAHAQAQGVAVPSETQLVQEARQVVSTFEQQRTTGQ